MNVEIITIGDELLIGQVVDTNSAWMGVELNKRGFSVKHITSVGDVMDDILQAFEVALQRADVVLVTGGIGPTKDDITKKALCTFFKTELRYDEVTYQTILKVLAYRNRPINELTRTQAWVPESATVIPNLWGTAPITWFERDRKVFVSMPGVPYEMKSVMENEILPRLLNRFPQQDALQHLTLLITGFSESTLAEYIAAWEEALPAFIRLAYLPQWGVIRLRLSGYHPSALQLRCVMGREVDKLKNLLGSHVVCTEDLPIEAVVGNRLMEKGYTLGSAESCTGGAIAQAITSVAGSSSYFNGAVVAYANHVKEQILNVRAETLDMFGAVSEQTVEEMARGAQRLLKCDCAIATSGIAGPGGGTSEKPVGTVCVAIAIRDSLCTTTIRLSGNREAIIQRTVNSVLVLLLEKLAD